MFSPRPLTSPWAAPLFLRAWRPPESSPFRRGPQFPVSTTTFLLHTNPLLWSALRGLSWNAWRPCCLLHRWCCSLHLPPGSHSPTVDNEDRYVRKLFVDFSSAFNLVIPQKLLGLSTSRVLPDPSQSGLGIARLTPSYWAMEPLRAVCWVHCCSLCWLTTVQKWSSYDQSSSFLRTRSWSSGSHNSTLQTLFLQLHT